MRLRREGLKTGCVLSSFHPEDRTRNASILFMVDGATDIEPLSRIEAAFQEQLKQGFQWSTVANQLELTDVDPALDSSKVTRFEVAEFQGMTVPALRAVFRSAVEQLRMWEPVRYPSASRIEGSVARGVDFLDRTEELKRLGALLRDRQHVLVVAPRRSGKTTLLLRLTETIGPRFRCEFIDAQAFRSVEALTAELRSRASEKSFTSSLKEVRASGWESALQEALRELASPRKRRLVLFLDELAYFLEHLGKPELMVQFLQAVDRACTRAKATLVIAGSIELHPVVGARSRSHLPGLFGKLEVFPLPPLAESKLDVEMRRVLLGTGLVLEEGDLAWLAQNVDLALPYPALRFLSHLASTLRGRSLGPKQLDRELIDYLRTTAAFADINDHLNRLADEQPDRAERIESVLDRLAQQGQLPATDVKGALGAETKEQAEMFEWLLEHLPVRVRARRLQLASRLFQQYWQTRRRGAR